MGNLLNFVRAVSAFITGEFGIGLMTIAIGATALAAACHAMRWNQVFHTVFYCAIAFSAGYIVQTFIGGA